MLVLPILLIRPAPCFAKSHLSDNSFRLIGCARVSIDPCLRMWFPKLNYAQQLSLLETVWSGAVRSRVILQELLSVSRQDEASFEALWNIVAGSSGDLLAPDFVLPKV